MAIRRKYTDYDLVCIYKLIVNRDRVGIKNSYPELIDYIDKFYYVLNYCLKRYIDNYESRYEIVEWVSGMISFINITNNKEFVLDGDIVDLIGDPRYFNFSDYALRYICLVYPEDMINHNINIYISQLYNLLRYIVNKGDIVNKKSLISVFSNNPTLVNLLNILKDIRLNHFEFYKNDYYRSIMMLIVSSCYYNNSDYNIVYNYINNPDFYINKLILNGFIVVDYKNKIYKWKKEAKKNVFLSANELFRENKVMIK